MIKSQIYSNSTDTHEVGSVGDETAASFEGKLCLLIPRSRNETFLVLGEEPILGIIAQIYKLYKSYAALKLLILTAFVLYL